MRRWILRINHPNTTVIIGHQLPHLLKCRMYDGALTGHQLPHLLKCRMYDGALTGLEDKEKIRRRSLSIDVSFILDLKIGL